LFVFPIHFASDLQALATDRQDSSRHPIRIFNSKISPRNQCFGIGGKAVAIGSVKSRYWGLWAAPLSCKSFFLDIELDFCHISINGSLRWLTIHLLENWFHTEVKSTAVKIIIPELLFLSNDDTILLLSESDGFGHLILYVLFHKKH